jgi:hypothetical protein
VIVDNIQEIVDEFKECQRERHAEPISENVWCAKYERIFKRLEQELAKTKKLHEIFKQNEPNKDTCNKFDCRYYKFFNETSYLLLEATEFFSKEEIYEAIKRVHDKLINKG